MSVTPPKYVGVPTEVTAVRYMHGVDCFGLPETLDQSAGFDDWYLTVPNADGDLIAREGDWVLEDVSTGIYYVCGDVMFRIMFTQEGVTEAENVVATAMREAIMS